MDKLKSFVRLDFMTVKPYFTGRNLLIYAVISLFISYVSGNFTSGISLGMFIAINFISYPFAVGEKSNMDAFYPTLSVGKGSVVLGRYIFTLALNLCALLFFILTGTAGLLATQFMGLKTYFGDPFAAIGMVLALVIVIQSMQLPLYFKLGYTKAKFFSLIPYIAIMVIFVLVTTMANNNSVFSMSMAYALEKAAKWAPLLAMALIPIVLISIRVSWAFYSKREF